MIKTSRYKATRMKRPWLLFSRSAVDRSKPPTLMLIKRTTQIKTFHQTRSPVAVVETPVNLSDAQKDLLRQFEESLNGGEIRLHKPKAQGFFEGVKRFFDDLTS